MTLNNNPIDIYFHMRNHYKKLKHVKSVIDCCPPKTGRCNPEKSTKVTSDSSSRSKLKHDRAKSATRPRTRRNVKETPRQLSKSAGRQEPSESFKTDANSFLQHEYLQFSLRITEDIIKNDMYDNDQMKRVLASHFEANKGKLDPDKMIAALYELCLELNIPISETLDSESKMLKKTDTDSKVRHKAPRYSEYKCICSSNDNLSEEEESIPCLCMAQRTPPIPCKVHPSRCALQIKRADSVKPDRPSDFSELDDTDNRDESQIRPSAASSRGKSVPEIEVLHSTKSSAMQSTESIPANGNICTCGSVNCIPDACSGSGLDTSIQDIVGEVESDLVLRNLDEDSDDKISLNDHPAVPTVDPYDDSSLYLGAYDDDGEEEQEEVNDVKPVQTIAEEPATIINVIDTTALTCDMQCLVMEYDRKMAHPKNMQMLNVSHYTTTIEPERLNKCDCQAQTSLEMIPFRGCCYSSDKDERDVCKKLSVSKATQSCAETLTAGNTHRVVIVPPKQSQHVQQPVNDFILLEGPVFIPKAVINKGLDMEHLKQKSSSNNCNYVDSDHNRPSCSAVKTHSVCTSCLHRNPEHQNHFDYPVPSDRHNYEKCTSCRTSSVYNKPQYPRYYQEYDITPQREISMYNNVNCKQTCRSSCCMRGDNQNLLLGNNYTRYSVDNTPTNMSYFYPTIATQVSSMDILNTTKGKTDSSKVLVEPELKVSKVVKDSLQVYNSSDKNSDTTASSYKSATNELQAEAFNKLHVIQGSDSTDSMDKRIQSLRIDMAKFREGDVKSSSYAQKTIPESPQKQALENQQRERGVSISEEVELIKDYEFKKKESL